MLKLMIVYCILHYFPFHMWVHVHVQCAYIGGKKCTHYFLMVVVVVVVIFCSIWFCVRTYVRVELLNFQYEGKTRAYFYIILIELLASRFPSNLHAQNEHDRNSIRQIILNMYAAIKKKSEIADKMLKPFSCWMSVHSFYLILFFYIFLLDGIQNNIDSWLSARNMRAQI